MDPDPGWPPPVRVGDHVPVSTQPSATRYALGSVPNMVRSLVVVLGIVLVIIFMIPRTGSVPRPAIDVTANAAAIAGSTGWAVEAPVGLPDGWRPTAARYDTTNQPVPTWFVGYQTPSGAYAALSQGAKTDAEWLAGVTGRGARTGERSIGGRTWVEYARADGTQNSLVDEPSTAGGLTTVVSGTAGWDELAALAGALRPVSADGTPSASASSS